MCQRKLAEELPMQLTRQERNAEKVKFYKRFIEHKISTLNETKGFARPISGHITEGSSSLQHFHCHQYFRFRDFMRQVQFL